MGEATDSEKENHWYAAYEFNFAHAFIVVYDRQALFHRNFDLVFDQRRAITALGSMGPEGSKEAPAMTMPP
jgi:hypothetical protein